MKKFLSFCFIIIMLFVCCSCSESKTENASSNDEVLLDVLYSEKEFINEVGNHIKLNSYEFSDGIYAKPSKYTIVDMDGDGQNELIADIGANSGIYMLFHMYDNNVYGFQFGIRSLGNLKTDGSFIASGGAAYTMYRRIEFEGTSYKIITLAEKADTIFLIDNIEVTETEKENFYKEWNKKPSAKWLIL